MLDTLGRVLQYVAQTGQRREVNRYLDNATQESVLRDLRKAIRWRKSEINDLQKTFDAHALEDVSTKQRYWCEDSLRNHIEKQHPHLTSSEDVLQLLWRSFHFYAFHPFPRSPTEGRIDLEGFLRALTMLAAQGADLLGFTEDIDSYWRVDRHDLYEQAKLKRIFRSIGTPEKLTNLDDESNHIVEETTDVLAMTQPFFMHNGPHEHQLVPAARRLLGENLIQTRRRVSWQDFATLLGVLVRLNLFKDNWGLSFPFGSFIPADFCGDKLASILVGALKDDHGEEEMGFEHVKSIMHLLPNLYIRFYQMWAVLFQPPMANDYGTPTSEPNHTTDPVLRSISLFIPHPVISTLRESRGEDRRIAFEDPIRFSDDEAGVTAAGVSDTLSKDTWPHILLVTGTDTQTSEPTVFGAYLPQESEGVALHLFFQLRPRFRLVPCSGAQKIMVNNTKIAEKVPSSKSTAIIAESAERNSPFLVGQSTSEGSCIRVDPENKVATLIIVPRYVEKSGPLSHNSSGLTENAQGGNIEVTFSDVSLLRVSGSVASVAPDLVKAIGVDDPPEEARIHGEELKSRIIGLGSG